MRKLRAAFFVISLARLWPYNHAVWLRSTPGRRYIFQARLQQTLEA